MNSVEYALNKMNREVGDRDTLKKVYRTAADGIDGEILWDVRGRDTAWSKVLPGILCGERHFLRIRCMKGLRRTLESLKNEGYILAVATSKPEEYAKRIADKFDFAKYFAGIYGATMDGSLIRKADVIRYALDSLGVERENYDQVVMVGDRNNDIYGAKENGIQVIGVLYGYGDLAELQSAGADYIAKMPEEITQIIRKCDHERV
mgnify:CR=1 FL=1